MRLVGLAMLLVSSYAYASPALPFEIVRILPETDQVLVFDRAHHTHVLLQPGSKFGDYTVIEISGIQLIVEKEQQRFTVYPREARYLALSLFERDSKDASQLPTIYGDVAPAPAPTQVVDRTAPIDKKTTVAIELASIFANPPTDPLRAPHALRSKR